jgi:hypothetical protein
LELTAYDHWSDDTKQDAWFTASSFDCVFEILDPKPKWIKVITDNGPHYHCSELMVIATNWYDWYGIEIRGWIFLEPGEAKTTIDSHHASVNFIFIYFFFTLSTSRIYNIPCFNRTHEKIASNENFKNSL